MEGKIEISRDVSKDEQMNFNEIIDIIEKSKIIGESNSIEMYFVKQTRSGYYYFFNAGFSDDVIKEIKLISINSAEKMKKLNQIEYDFYKNKGEGNIEIINTKFINKSLKRYMDCKSNKDYQIKNFDPKDIHHYVFHFKYQGKSVYAFRRFDKMTDLRKGAFGTFNDGSFEILNNKKMIIGLNSTIDMFIYNNQIAINVHSVLERIFDINHEFKKNAEDILEEISKKPDYKNKIENFEEFSKDALQNKSATKRLTHVKYNKHRMKSFFNNFERTEEVNKLFNLELKFDGNKVIYRDKKDITPITMLMNDAFYKTLIAQEPGITE